MKYNHTQVTPMMLFADYAGDLKVLAAAKKLADFMIRYSFPDGSYIGCFDGRQSWYMGYYSTLCYGFDRWPRGKELNRRIYRSRKKWGLLDPNNKYYNLSDWYAYFGFGFLMDEFLGLRLQAPASKLLPQDRNGYLMVEKGPTFNGGTARNHDWMVAISAIYSDLPRITDSPYRLSRQSRLDVWHRKTGLIIGGGSSQRQVEVPLANFHLLTGYAGVECDFGLLSGGSLHDRLAVYNPRAVDADITLERQILRESYGQGDVTFTVVPLDEKRLKIIFAYDVFTLKKLVVQLPLIIYYNTVVSIDGKPCKEDKMEPVTEEVLLSNPTMGSSVKIILPEGADARLRASIPPLRWYGEPHPPGRYEPFYHIRLLNLEIENPPAAGSGEFLAEVIE